MSADNLKHVVEAALLAAGRPLTVDDIIALFEGSGDSPERKQVREALSELSEDWEGRVLELVEVSSGFRLQVRKEFSTWLGRLWAERPPRYSRALMETLALIAYRQPITRGDIEEIRGVAVSSHIIKTLMEREWIRVVGHKDVPGRPAMYATTRKFLDYFNLRNLDDLPTLADIKDLDSLNGELVFADQDGGTAAGSDSESGSEAAAGTAPEGDVLSLQDDSEPDADDSDDGATVEPVRGESSDEAAEPPAEEPPGDDGAADDGEEADGDADEERASDPLSSRYS